MYCIEEFGFIRPSDFIELEIREKALLHAILVEISRKREKARKEARK